MSEVWIVNSSPLIVLAKAGLERLLTDLPDELTIPAAVQAEVLDGPEGDAARRLLESGWGQIAPTTEVPASVAEWGLGAGESAAIAHALRRPDAMVVLDDAMARACARTLGLHLLGTLGIILRAKAKALIPSAADTYLKLRACGLYVDDRTIEAALRSVGEQWNHS